MTDSVADDERALSESAGVAVLVGLVVLMTASVGVYVLVVQEDTGPPTANFTYQYIDQSSALLITHSRGDEIPAGDLVVEGPRASANWSALASTNASSMVGPGDRVQISEGNEYGRPVTRQDTIRIYLVRNGNRTQLDTWAGGS
ncbi:MAG: type IV pilin [Haloarculaceae archaeon]